MSLSPITSASLPSRIEVTFSPDNNVTTFTRVETNGNTSTLEVDRRYATPEQRIASSDQVRNILLRDMREDIDRLRASNDANTPKVESRETIEGPVITLIRRVCTAVKGFFLSLLSLLQKISYLLRITHKPA